MALVRTTDLIYENNVAPTGADNFAAGFKVGDDWRDTVTDNQYNCIGNGVWVNLTTALANSVDISCSITRTSNVSVLNNVFGFVVPFNAEKFDTANMHDNAVNNTRITIPSTGKYAIGANIGWAVNAVGIRSIAINSNIQGFLMALDSSPATGAVLGNSQNVSTIVELVAGEILELWTYQNSGAPLDIVQDSTSPNLWVRKIS